jgi:DNA ligase 1
VLYCFDCLYLNGEVLLKKPLQERREAMHKAIVPQEGKVQFATCKTSKDVEELQVCARKDLHIVDTQIGLN